MPRLKKQSNVAFSASSSLDLVEDSAERQRLESLRDGCISAQLWHEDRAFMVGFRRGEEIAWSDMQDFANARADYLDKIRRDRRGQLGRVGERKIKKYGAGAVWVQARSMLLIIGCFVFAAVAMLNGFWLPKSDGGLDVWLSADERAELQRQEAAVTVYPGEDFESSPAIWVAPEIEQRRELVRKLGMLGFGMLGWHILRRTLFRPLPKEIIIPKVIKLDTLPE